MRAHWIAALTALALVACGESKPLTHDEFVERADEICAEYGDKIVDVYAGLSPDSSEDERKDAIGNFVDVYEDMAEAITDLEPPGNDRAIAQYLNRLKRNANGLRQGAEDDELMTENFARAEFNSMMKARDLAEDAGMHGCAALEI